MILLPAETHGRKQHHVDSIGRKPFFPDGSLGWKQKTTDSLVDWVVGCFGLNGPLRQYFSLYRAVSQREGERKER